MTVQNKAQLITYPDSLGGDLMTLRKVLQRHFRDIFPGGVHILPPYPSSGDRGFAPLTYLEIEPAFGSWADIRAIGEDFPVLLDVMVNHMSQKSHYFQDFLAKGKKSPYAHLFLTLDKIWPGGEPVAADIEKIFLRRPRPYSTFHIKATEEEVKVWTTFGKEDPSEQIDLDVNSPQTRKLFADIFAHFSKNNVQIVRLDAVGYVVKKLGTSCFFVEPEIYTFLQWIQSLAHSVGIEILPEVHAHYSIQYALARRGYWIYDFILPYTVLEALIMQSSHKLRSYLKERPPKQFTMLDCHDGIPVLPDVEGLIDTRTVREVVDICLSRGANLSKILGEAHKGEGGFDVHQINCTYYSALGENDDAYLAARAIQLFVPGIPQIYYVGLLAGQNDYRAVDETGDGRAVNRHNFTEAEIEQALHKEVVQRLLAPIRFRNTHPAFAGTCTVEDGSDTELKLLWAKDGNYCRLSVDFTTYKAVVEYSDDRGAKQTFRI